MGRDTEPHVIVRAVEGLGRLAIEPIEEVGRVAHIGLLTLLNLVIPPIRVRETIRMMEFIGVQSLPIIVLSAAFTGSVFTLQSYAAYHMFGAQGYVGGTVGVALTRELAPTLTGLLVAGRAGSAMAAEIGAMRVSEQIDALEAMAVDPINYLVKPRVVAATLVTPILTGVFDIVGCVGAYVCAIYVLHMSYPEFMVRLEDWIDPYDIWSGLLKATVFGTIIGTVACYKGFYTRGGAAGVGRATTTAVVVSSVAILITNYFIVYLLPVET